MLDRTKIIHEITNLSAQINTLVYDEYERARLLWQAIAYDETFCRSAWAHSHDYLIPSWSGQLATAVRMERQNYYNVVGFDGSQIYPDRHQGIECFLVNIGQAHFRYGEDTSSVFFNSTPAVTVRSEHDKHDFTPQFVNAYRTEMELRAGFNYLKAHQSPLPSLFLCDGSLIFWHLQSESKSIESDFLPRYLSLMDDFFAHQFLFAGYISLSKSRELVNLVKIAGELKNESSVRPPNTNSVGLPDDTKSNFTYLVDGDIASLYLHPGERSRVFSNHSGVVEQYPLHSRPHFFYLNTGDEIARVEIPAWIATNPAKLELVSAMIYDQVCKGYGYPLALAEAHEQAVVENADREFFYYLLKTTNQKAGFHYSSSSKSEKKRRSSI